MSAVVKKLKSNSGATLMLALLFFVVCAVTGSMVLLSATVASGRFKDMRESDQNYYAVRSAVKFMEERLQGEEYIRVVETMTIEEEEEKDEETGEVIGTNYYYTYSGPVMHFVKDGGSTDTTISSDITSQDNMLCYLLTNSAITNYDDKCSGIVTDEDNEEYPDEFNLKWFKDIDDPNEAGVTVEHAEIKVTSGGDELSGLSVDMKMNLCSSGILTVTVTNTDAADKKNKYSMILKMQCEKSGKTVESDSGNKNTKTKTYDFTFKTLSVEKA